MESNIRELVERSSMGGDANLATVVTLPSASTCVSSNVQCSLS